MICRNFGKLSKLGPGWAEAGGEAGDGGPGEDMSMFRIGYYPGALGQREGVEHIQKYSHF